MRLPESFIENMAEQLVSVRALAAFLSTYYCEPRRGFRVNTLKMQTSEFLEAVSWKTAPGGFSDDCVILKESVESIGNHPAHIAGAIYMQEPSAAITAAMSDIDKGMRVLDMCAAPGGKSGAAAAMLSGEGVLVSNEIVSGRAKTLKHTLERMGVVNSIVTSASPDVISNSYGDVFDRVIVDAPCSGEGMFRKDANAVSEWSQEHVRACANRQRLILESAAKCVIPGGKLIYSTCTFSREEDEETIEYFLKTHDDFYLLEQKKLYPHIYEGEGHYCAVLVRKGEAHKPELKPASNVSKRYKPCKEACVIDFFKQGAKLPGGLAPYMDDRGDVLLMTEDVYGALRDMYTLSAGVHAGTIIKGRFEPSHTIFMAAGMGFANKLVFEQESRELKRFLAGEELDCDKKGYTAVCVKIGETALPIGFGKASDGRLKSKYPKGLRIR
ncbi:MAG: hypothetical protein KIG43_00945 [Eubacteriales bacterium]|nr:hypothetical protein [Eubacteriales bacterium]MCI7570706.1 hypothetical protein [Clostridiales bacterium]